MSSEEKPQPKRLRKSLKKSKKPGQVAEKTNPGSSAKSPAIAAAKTTAKALVKPPAADRPAKAAKKAPARPAESKHTLKTGSGKMPGPVTKWVSTAEVLALPVHPIAEYYPMGSDEVVRGLGQDMKSRTQLNPIIVCDCVVLDGRTRLKGASFAGIKQVKVKYYTGLGELEIRAMITSCNDERRHMTSEERTTAALQYYDDHRHVRPRVTIQDAAALFRAGKRSVDRRIAARKTGPKKRKVRASMSRIPTYFRETAIFLSGLSQLKETSKGKRAYKRYYAKIRQLADDITSWDEMAGVVEYHCMLNDQDGP